MNITTSGKVTIQYHPKVYLLKALKKAKLPCTYKTLIKYEKMGIIQRPASIATGYEDRFYTDSEINKIIEEVRAYAVTLRKSKKDEKYLKKFYKGK